jgi:hypothetical protein
MIGTKTAEAQIITREENAQMPNPSPRRVLAVPASGSIVSVAYQDARGNRQIWSVPYEARAVVYDAIRDLRPTKVISTIFDHTLATTSVNELTEGIRAVCRVCRVPLVIHAHSRADAHLPYAEQYLEQTRAGTNEGYWPEEARALAHLLCHLEEIERDRTARALR